MRLQPEINAGSFTALSLLEIRLLHYVTILAVVLLLSSCAIVNSETDPLPEVSRYGRSFADLAREILPLADNPIDADALAVMAVVANPQLRALRSRENVAEAQVFAAGLYPDPSVAGGFDKPLNGVGVITAFLGSVSLDIAGFIRRPFVQRAARDNRDAVRFDIAWAEWLTAQQARLLATRIAHLTVMRGHTIELRGLADKQLGQALAAVGRGDLAASGLEARRLGATDAADRDRSTESLLNAAALELNRLLGIEPAERVPIAAPASNAPDLLAAPELFVRATQVRADLSGLRAAYDGSRAMRDLSMLGAYPLPAITFSGARDTSNIHSVGPTVSFNLPLWNRGRGDVAIAEASRAQMRAEYAARLETVRADIAATRNALVIAKQQLADVSREISPLVPYAAAAQRAAERGDLAESAATATRMTLLDKQIIETGLAQSVAELTVALELAVGEIGGADE